MSRAKIFSPSAELTADQMTLCVEARRAYFRASAALDQFEGVFKFQCSYRDFGRLPRFDWERIAELMGAAQAASAHFNALIAQVDQAGIKRDQAMLVEIREPKSELDLAMEAHRKAYETVIALMRTKPTPAQRERAKAILEAANG